MSTKAPASQPGEALPHRVEVSAPELLCGGYKRYERFNLTLHPPDGPPLHQQRDVLRAGHTVGVLPYDPARDSVVLIRQFRLPAWLVLGAAHAEMVEIVAGGIEAGEAAARAAMRECAEETGLAPSALIPMLRFMPTPGIIDEHASFFLGVVDATHLPERGGLDGESELTRPFLLPVDEAIALVTQGPDIAPACSNGYLIIALQWLALNRARLPTLIAASREAPSF